MRRFAAIACALTLLSGASVSQSLSINGSQGSVLVPLGATATTELTGQPQQIHFWFLGLEPGPTVVSGVSIPIRLATAADLGGGAPLPQNGVRTLLVPLPLDPVLSGTVWYSVGVLYAPATALGFEVTNGVAATLSLPGASAGPDRAAFVEDVIVLDGSGNRDGSGQIPSGTDLLWIAVETPNGATVTIDRETTEFPAIRTDTPGSYEFELQVDGPSGFSADRVRVDVFALQFAQALGAFSANSSPISGTVAGPAVGIAVGGSAVPLTNGAFSSPAQPLVVALEGFDVEVTGANGSRAHRRMVLAQGSGAPIAAPANPGTVSRLQNVDLSFLSAPIALLLGALPLNQVVTAIPAIPILNTTFFSATVQFTSATYDTANVTAAILPGTSGGFSLVVTIPNLMILADLTGTLFFAPYAEVATISASAMVLTGEFAIVADPVTCAPSVDLVSSSTTFQNFGFSVTGALGGLTQIALIQTAIQGALELAFGSILQLIPTAINPLLASLVLPPVDLTPAGIPVSAEFPIAGISYDATGLSLITKLGVTPTSVAPGSPVIADARHTAAPLPTFTATTPVNGAPFDVAFGVNDDAWNQLLAALTTTGGLSTGLAGLTAGAVASAIPGAGFDLFPTNATVDVGVRTRVAPVVTFAPGAGASSVGLVADGLEITFSIDDGFGSLPLLVVSAGATSDLTIGIDPVTGTLTVVPGPAVIEATVLSALAGQDPSAGLAAGVAPLVQAVLDLIALPLASLPLPGAVLGSPLASEISVHPTATDTLLIYVDLP